MYKLLYHTVSLRDGTKSLPVENGKKVMMWISYMASAAMRPWRPHLDPEINGSRDTGGRVKSSRPAVGWFHNKLQCSSAAIYNCY